MMRAVFLIALVLAPMAPLRAAAMGASDVHDLDELRTLAERHYDLSAHDAILLLECEEISIQPNGDRRTRIHRVAWIGTEIGIRDHADLRIPYNSATSTMRVAALRTWRDDRWWPMEPALNPTAIVETLPFEIENADDYTAMREMMLLHDGVELPCIVETAYVIEERGAAAEGAEGLWIFAKADPAVRSCFVLDVPEGSSLSFHTENGAPKPEISRAGDGMVTYEWKMEPVDRLGVPRLADPACYAPYVTWSTWNDWSALGARISSSIDGAAALSDALSDTLSERLRHELSPASKARNVVDFVNESTRPVRYDDLFWAFSPRPASRTWETAYGHRLDRTVLAAALLREAGLVAEPIYVSAGFGEIDGEIPCLSRFGGLALWVSGEQLSALYDPMEGTLADGPGATFGRTVWRPGIDEIPRVDPSPNAPNEVSHLELLLTLEPDDEGGWSGSGFFSADGLFSPHHEMVGLGSEAIDHLGAVAGSVLPGAEVGKYNPETFTRGLVTLGFELTIAAEDPDDQGRVRVTIGDPSGGIRDQLPSDVNAYDAHRGSPVVLAGKMAQRVRLRLKVGEREVVYRPEGRELENDAGRLAIHVEAEDGWVTVSRELLFSTTRVASETWPDLRALLLAESDAAGRTILIK